MAVAFCVVGLCATLSEFADEVDDSRVDVVVTALVIGAQVLMYGAAFVYLARRFRAVAALRAVGVELASALLSSDETEEAQKFCRETLRKLKRGCPPNDARVVTCVKSTSASSAGQFFTKSFLGDGVAVLALSRAEEPAPPRYRAGVASMAWRTTRRFSTKTP